MFPSKHSLQNEMYMEPNNSQGADTHITEAFEMNDSF